MSILKPLSGIGVMILKYVEHEKKVLLGRRTGSHGEGEYAFPGGQLKYMESFDECARRETLSECGIEIQDIRFQFVSNVTKYNPKHYIHIGLTANWTSGEPRVLEPKKCMLWKWYDIKELPQPLFEMSKQGIRSYKTGTRCYDCNLRPLKKALV